MDIAATLQQALTHHRSGDLTKAQALYREVLSRSPDHPDALHLLGVMDYQQGRYGPAVENIQRSLAINPNDAAAFSNLGLALRRLERWDDAVAAFDRALALRPGHLPALNNRGSTLRDLERHDEALASYDRALSLDPGYAEAHKNRGALLLDLHRYEEALASYDRALALQGDDGEALFGRGNALVLLHRPAEALDAFDRMLSSAPDHTGALRNRGSALIDLERYDEALATTDRALASKPDDKEALSNRGHILVELGRPRAALEAFERALALLPDDADTQYNAGLCRLVLGDFERGWRDYEARWQTDTFRDSQRAFAAPRWRGESSLAGKTILLHSEQGLGDSLQFCRYAPLVAATTGATVLLQVPPPLVHLLATLDGVARVLASDETLPAFDYHCPLLSLPLAFATTLDRIPAAIPYLHSDARLVAQWQQRLGEKKRPRIGLVWAGGTAHKTDHKRSIALSKILRLTAARAQFVSLQKEGRPGDRALLREHPDILDCGDALYTLSDTAALIATLDLVITADTAVAHLAGALGKDVWILLPFNPDWRWLLERRDSPWYPTARLFRQPAAGDWDSVMAAVSDTLDERLRDQARRH